MRNWLLLVREIAWTAVISVILAVIGVFLVIFSPDLFNLALILGISSASFAILSNRE